ncbi:LOW QUALITY PROTEIN: sorting nexin-2 [Leptinotarsa decemlineata]|uniref:LOW QUALITY PROTEIN: sorting nexin-2 n=1 Tax=Leptinotarsa decemlineata TaxID=7539 RepID=UPI000C252D9B|nr:sorting nexin-2 [Leptinotarsa decemlineata]
MADSLEPPPLFENVDILGNEKEDEDDNLFMSAHQEPMSHIENNSNFSKTFAEAENGISKMDLKESKEELESVPINNSSSLPSSMEQVESKLAGDDFLEISITEPQKVGEGMGAYMAYRITTKTNMRMFKNKEFSVTRRFSDFLGLHDKLTEKYLKVGRIIPPAPEKSVIGMTKIKMSSQEGPTANGNDFVERRRASLERYLKRTAEHPVLVLDPDFREFLESDVELPKATNTSALSSAGVMRLFNKVGETVNKITYKMDETDPWFEEKLNHVEALETQLRKLHASVEAMVSYRKELANLTNGVSRSAAMLSACEDHNSLSRALSQLAETEEKVEALHLEQANTDFFILCELLKDYLGLLGAVRDAFHERTKLFQHWQHSQHMLAKKREAKTKYELTNRNDKMDQANAEVVEWESKVERGQDNFDRISQMIKKEMERFEKCRIHDFKVMFIKYLENHLEHQAQLVKYWEAFLPEAKAIA